jgi:hypothetical protein
MSILDGNPGFVNQSTMAILDQVHDGDPRRPPGILGLRHGTIVAGVIHLLRRARRFCPSRHLAPTAADITSDVLRALYKATLRCKSHQHELQLRRTAKELEKASRLRDEQGRDRGRLDGQ